MKKKKDLIQILACLLFTEFTIISCLKNATNPLLLLISFDGFRWDYLSKSSNLPNFESLKLAGSHANYVKNTFATVTFPNHWSIVTGLYQESHGILNNHMFDPLLNITFETNTASMVKEWYDPFNIALPIWTLNTKAGNGRLSAAEWLGSNIIFNETGVINVDYNRSRPFNEIIDQFISFFKNKNPINFGAIYFDEPDLTGHKYGPDSIELKNKLEELDSNLGYLIEKLKINKLYDIMNIIITSDHGMHGVGKNKKICLENHLNLTLFDVYGGVVSKNLFIKKKNDTSYIYDKLKNIPYLDVYKKGDFPQKYHYKNNIRFGDILIVARLGYVIYERCNDIKSPLKGAHGYYNNESSMLPFFIAKGPAFRKNYKIENFDIVDIYPLMCAVLELKPGINNGSLANVESMLLKFSRKHFILYAFIALTPIVTAILTAFFLFCINKRSNLPGQTTNAYDGYKIISTSETNSLANNEELTDNAEL